MERAELSGDLRQHRLQVLPFTGTDDLLRVDDVALGPVTNDPHGGGDLQLLYALSEHLRNPNLHRELITSLDSSVPSHLLAFLAEESRLTGGRRMPVPTLEEVLQRRDGTPTPDRLPVSE